MSCPSVLRALVPSVGRTGVAGSDLTRMSTGLTDRVDPKVDLQVHGIVTEQVTPLTSVKVPSAALITMHR